MKQRTLYQVRVTQEIPFCDYDEDGEETQVSSGRIEEYVAGRFSAEHNAKLFAEATKSLEMTPYSREEYENAYKKVSAETELERARKFMVRCWLGMGSSNVYKNGFRSSQQGNSPKTTKHWGELPDRVLLAAERLKHAQIEKLPALELLKRYDTPDVFIYLDPPYLPGTRKGYLYNIEMTEKDHIELLKAIKKHPGKVLISGYDNDLYNEILNGWSKAQKQTQAEHGLKRIETVWFNYEKEYQLKF